jgi:hypothetical protein
MHPRYYNLGFLGAILAARQNLPLPQPKLMNDEFWELTNMCWEVDPNSRPTMCAAVQRLIPPSKNSQCSNSYSSGHDQSCMPTGYVSNTSVVTPRLEIEEISGAVSLFSFANPSYLLEHCGVRQGIHFGIAPSLFSVTLTFFEFCTKRCDVFFDLLCKQRGARIFIYFFAID